MITRRKPSQPIALAVGFSEDFVRKQEPAIARAGAVLLASSVASAADMVGRWTPGVILMTEDVYTFDADHFDALAKQIGASIAILRDECESPLLVEGRVARALARSGYAEEDREEGSAPRFSTIRPGAATEAAVRTAQLVIGHGRVPSKVRWQG